MLKRIAFHTKNHLFFDALREIFKGEYDIIDFKENQVCHAGLFDTIDLAVIQRFHDNNLFAPVYFLLSQKETPPILDFSFKVMERPVQLKDLEKSLKELSSEGVLLLGEFKLYLHNRRLIHNDDDKKSIVLTEKEVSILEYLHEIYPHSVDRETFLQDVWKYKKNVTTHTLETHVYRLKKKLIISSGKSLLKTTQNGYALNLQKHV